MGRGGKSRDLHEREGGVEGRGGGSQERGVGRD